MSALVVFEERAILLGAWEEKKLISGRLAAIRGGISIASLVGVRFAPNSV
jgi:hypothetical protein